ncbi:MAG: ABC transporter permease [Zetaproteobacteria bacterium CG12_big_fil_rev_8_21_14_0_65_54_13]|nr:MAG: ABC transporter permease [Zetaproteobacteria bacterium CG23_combo_of_CG06-09_8_20_14_all_54_7]PIW50020.1 MAG: ABC transporter permease [Zetaproteobacteria bacterium CG12_big_fil_rev_8_21_14_0_65_54_13]PIX54646.1 MAG: ABC transporter permease [Zetaproteobacteria bacterium CG_4_10_14_3_um_filter_54_28]PJA30740.1 MAG: ABC transporter permease [Zetaproteobacteria bacterium CG_4_9_14_3_um_filter_54_145]
MTLRWFALACAIAACLLIGLGAGDTWINPFHAGNGLENTILWELRLPRLLTAFAVGGLLALAGAWFQVLLGNPLAEPYVLGVAGSASAGAVTGLMFMPESTWVMSAGAFIGAWVGIVAVLFFSRLGPNRMLLAGVVLAAFWSAVLALLLALLPEQGLFRAFSWMMGDLSHSDLPVTLLLLAWVIALACGLILSGALDKLLLGERHAEALGVDVKRLRLRLLLLASAVTALAVTAAGTIGFVGLVIPHLMRLIFGSLHRAVLPASAIGGGLLLVLADSAARTIIAPAELPVGILTAMIGVPVFLFLLLRRN